jgi:hypothetical protein
MIVFTAVALDQSYELTLFAGIVHLFTAKCKHYSKNCHKHQQVPQTESNPTHFGLHFNGTSRISLKLLHLIVAAGSALIVTGERAPSPLSRWAIGGH